MRASIFRGRRVVGRRFKDSHLLDHTREVRDRLFVDDRRLRIFRLPDFRQVAAGQDREKALCHGFIKTEQPR
jgi:hypothetical protein